MSNGTTRKKKAIIIRNGVVTESLETLQQGIADSDAEIAVVYNDPPTSDSEAEAAAQAALAELPIP